MTVAELNSVDPDQGTLLANNCLSKIFRFNMVSSFDKSLNLGKIPALSVVKNDC